MKDFVEKMKDIERRYKRESKLPDRSWYKIFYCQVRPAKLLALGFNPGGDPCKVAPNGIDWRHGCTGPQNSSSDSYFENGEHDVFDCDWKENKFLRELAKGILGCKDENVIRNECVKTNLIFRRSPRKKDIKIVHRLTEDEAMKESQPFLCEIIDVVCPRLIVLGGVKLEGFAQRYCSSCQELLPACRDVKTRQTVLHAAKVQVRRLKQPALAVQVPHASRFGWMYEKYQVSSKIRVLLSAVH